MIEISCLLRRTGGGGPGIKTPQEKSAAMKPAAVEGAKSAAMKSSAVEGALKPDDFLEKRATQLEDISGLASKGPFPIPSQFSTVFSP